MNDSSASATFATPSSDSKKASQDAETIFFITRPPFVDQVRLVTGLLGSAAKMRWTGVLAEAGGLSFERRAPGCTLCRMTEHGNAMVWGRVRRRKCSACATPQMVLSIIALSSAAPAGSMPNHAFHAGRP